MTQKYLECVLFCFFADERFDDLMLVVKGKN